MIRVARNVNPLYQEPDIRDIRRIFYNIGYDEKYNPELVQDLAVTAAARMIGIVPQFQPEGDPYLEKLKDFLFALDFTKFSGQSPIAKAASVLQFLHNSRQLQGQGGEAYQKNTEGEGEGEGKGEGKLNYKDDSNAVDSSESSQGMIRDFLPEEIRTEKANGEERQMGAAGADKEPPGDPTAKAKAANEAVSEIRKFAATSAMEYANLNGVPPEVAAGLISKETKAMINKISLLKQRTQIRTSKPLTNKTVLKMRNYGELPAMASVVEMIKPTFGMKLATKQLGIVAPVEHAKQSVVFLIDISGSMSYKEKTDWVRALLLDRYDQVMARTAELFIVPFEGDAYVNQTLFIGNARDVRKNLKWFPEFNGGGTDIQKAVGQVSEQIISGRVGKYVIRGERPQIVVINDGQDYVREDYKPKVVTHGFILGQHNPGMKAMCENSGGSYELLWRGN